MASSIHGSLTRLRRRVALATYLGSLSMHMLVAALAGGSVALLLRIGLGLDPGQAVWALAVVGLTPLTAWFTARRRRLSSEGAAAYLDVRAGATGALLTELELSDPRWSSRAQAALARVGQPPRVRSKPLTQRALLSIAFAALVLWVPVPVALSGPGPVIYQASLDDLREKLETLEEQIQFEEETAAELEERLDRLQDEAQRVDNPEAMFEAMAEMDKGLEDLAKEAQAASEQSLEEVAQAAAMAQTDPAAAQSAMEAALAKLTQEGIKLGLPTELAQELGLDPLLENVDFPPGVALDPSQFQNLSDELAELLAEKLAELADAGLLDLSGLGGLGEFDLADLANLSLADLADLELCEDCKNGEP